MILSIQYKLAQGYERVARAYEPPATLKERFDRLRFGVPAELKWRGEVALEVEKVAKPSDYVWENVSTPAEVGRTPYSCF